MSPPGPLAGDFPRTRAELDAFFRQRLGELQRVAIQRIQTIGVAPTGAAGGVLSGSYPNPGFAADMATQAELDAHAADTTAVHGIADTSDLVVTADIATFVEQADIDASLAATRFEQTFGDAVAASFNIDHNFGTRDVLWAVYDTSTHLDLPIGASLLSVDRSTTNRLVLTFAAAPANNQYRIVVRR